MRTCLCLIMCLAASTAFGADIVAKVPGPDGVKTIVLTTNDTRLHYMDWVATSGGGMWEIHGHIEKDMVVLTGNIWRIEDEDVRTDTSTKVVVPTNKIPREVAIGTMKIELVRVEKE